MKFIQIKVKFENGEEDIIVLPHERIKAVVYHVNEEKLYIDNDHKPITLNGIDVGTYNDVCFRLLQDEYISIKASGYDS